MFTVFIRTILLYISMIVAMRVMGKKQVGELQPSELVVSIAISDLASIPMQNMDQPLLSGLIPILTLMCLEVILSFITLKSRFIRTALSGKPCILISHGKINEKELAKMRYNLADLTEELRTAGYPDVREVEYAVLETTGTLNIIPASDKRPLTPADCSLNPPAAHVFITVISDGRLLRDGLAQCGHTEAWLKDKLFNEYKISRYREVFYAAVGGDDLHVQKRGCA